MGHTPGPWTIEYETEGGEPYDDGVRIDSPEGPVAFNVIDCSARLIAAAPDLLAALKQCLPLVDAYRRASGGDGDVSAAYARSVIAKAEGTDEQARPMD